MGAVLAVLFEREARAALALRPQRGYRTEDQSLPVVRGRIRLVDQHLKQARYGQPRVHSAGGEHGIDRRAVALTAERGQLVHPAEMLHPKYGLLQVTISRPRGDGEMVELGERGPGGSFGEPSLLDEDLALAFCREAGIGPERCLGLARFSEFRTLRGHGSGDDGGSGEIRTVVKGVVAIHPEEGSGAFERMLARAPLDLPSEPEGVHVEVLNWEAIAGAVHDAQDRQRLKGRVVYH